MEKHMIAYLKNRIGELELDKAGLYAEIISLKGKLESENKTPKKDVIQSGNSKQA